MYSTTLEHKSKKNMCVSKDPWMIRFRSMVHLNIYAPSGVYGAILKVLCMLRQEVSKAAELQDRV